MVTKITRVKKTPVKQVDDKPVKLKEKKDAVANRKKAVKAITRLENDLNLIRIKSLEKNINRLNISELIMYGVMVALLLENLVRYS